MWIKLSAMKSLFIFIVINIILCESTPASPHIHSKERVQDGNPSPKDKNHVVNGEHHTGFDHESILGSMKKAEEFDKLEPEEAKKRLKILLTKMDSDKDQHINKKELHAWIVRSFKMLSEEESHDRFEDTDDDDDGKVSWAEYIEETYGIDSHENEKDLSLEDQSNEEKLLSDDKALFEAADKNKDGSLTKSEFLRFNNPEDHPDMLPILLKQALEDKDHDGDGTISFHEFAGEKGTAKTRDKEWLLVEKEKFDNEFDKNKDGKLNEDEILNWVVPSDEEIAEDEVVHLFSSSDDDNNGVLSFDEILEHHETFVGSEATDYGDHLHNIHIFQDEL